MESEHPTLLLTQPKQKQALEAEKGGAAAQARFFPSAWHPVTFTPHGRGGIINKNFAGDLFRKVIPNETEAEWPLVQLLARKSVRWTTGAAASHRRRRRK